MMGVCQSKISSSERLIGSVWSSSADGSVADAAGGGAVVGYVRKNCRVSTRWSWLRSCMIWASGVASVEGAGGGELTACGMGGVGGVGAKVASTSGVRAGPSVELAVCVSFWASAGDGAGISLMAGRWCGHSRLEWDGISEVHLSHVFLPSLACPQECIFVSRAGCNCSSSTEGGDDAWKRQDAFVILAGL
ncbi:hypothetical protein V6N11_058338 [Hibiscus sabdariffa]|uniref:Uncharacterized protein n=1 Tax=Hibiscus sabdariffa TaxID=183260 RepID=A0ABR2U4Q3_9ROSI